jgi:hypothetical protein
MSCTQNELKVENLAEEEIHLNFRAEVYDVDAEETITITDIPNGTYSYSTTYTLPQGINDYDAGGAVSGSMRFSFGRTKNFLLYSSITETDNTGLATYKISATLSTSESSTAQTTAP